MCGFSVKNKFFFLRGVIMSLALRCWMGDVHHCSGLPSRKRTILSAVLSNGPGGPGSRVPKLQGPTNSRCVNCWSKYYM